MATEEQQPCLEGDGTPAHQDDPEGQDQGQGHADDTNNQAHSSSETNNVDRNDDDHGDDDDDDRGGELEKDSESAVVDHEQNKNKTPAENDKNGDHVPHKTGDGGGGDPPPPPPPGNGKTNGDSGNSDYTHSNGVNKGENGRGGGGGGGDGVRKRRQVSRQMSQEEAALMTQEELEAYIPEPPDGGWGWVIVACSMVNNLIVDGIGYTFGVFLIEFVDAFQAPSSKVSLVGSLLCGIYLFAGPIVSSMTNKFGCRAVVIAGSLTATIAFLLATRAPNLDMLICTYGVIGGFGLGMMYLPSIVSVGFYFQEKRAFATGLAVAGSGLGTFVFPPLSEYLLNHYDWRGALLIISGFIFNGCVTGALMRPLEATPHKEKKAETKPREKGSWDRVQEYFRNRTQSNSTNAPNDEIAAGVEEAKLRREKKLQETDSILGSVPSVAFHRVDSVSTADGKKLSTSTAPPDSPATSGQGSQPATPSIIIELEDETGAKVSQDVIILDSPKKDFKDSRHEANSPSHKKKSKGAAELAPLLSIPSSPRNSGGGGGRVLPGGCGGSRSNLYHLSSMRSLHMSKKDLAKDLARPMYRKDIFYGASVQNISQFQSQPDVKSYIASIITLPAEKDMLDSPPSSAKCINKFCSCLPHSVRDVLSEMVDVSLFKDVSFMLICLGNFFAFLGFFVPFVFVVDKAVDIGIEKGDATFLISIIGIMNTIGRVVVGKLVDKKILDSLVVSYVSITLCGIVTALTPFCDSYALLAVDAALFGTGMAAFISLSSIIICDRMGVEKLTNAFGLMSMTRGLSGMVGPPLAGKLYDMTGSYSLSFFVAGLFFLIGAACHMLLHLPCLRVASAPPPMMAGMDLAEIEIEEIEGPDFDLGPKEEPHIIRVEDITEDE